MAKEVRRRTKVVEMFGEDEALVKLLYSVLRSPNKHLKKRRLETL
ncbi:MAG: transposase [Nanopusillaceae archaeon]